jgi:fluoroquinolone resistance protein
MEFSFEANSEYSDQDFKKISYGNRTVSQTTFQNCTFTDCSFQETTFLNCKFRDCTFKKCNMRLMKVAGSSFRNVVFEQSSLIGVNWVDAAWSKQGLLDSIGFIECDISHSTFIGLALKKLVVQKSTAKNTDFAEANLTQADFTGTDLAESRFLHTNLTEADFTDAYNYAIDVQLNTVKQAKFALPEAVNLLRCMDIVLVDAIQS